jgi:hypothetical protein
MYYYSKSTNKNIHVCIVKVCGCCNEEIDMMKLDQ